MRVLLLSVGSRGDVEPYCALTQELLKRNHQVDLFLQRDLAHLAQPFQEQSTVPSKNNHPSSFQLHTFPFTNQDFYKCHSHQNRHHHPDPKMKNVGIVADIIGELILPCVDQVLAVVRQQQEKDENCQQQWIIVSSAFTRCLAILIGQALEIPTILLHLQPLVPNRIFPSYRTSRTKFVQACCRSCLDDNGNDNNNNNNDESNHHKNDDESVQNHYCEETYWKIEHALEEVFLKDRMTLAYQKLGIMSPLSWEDLQRILSGRDPRFWMVNAYSNHLIPSLVEASPNTPSSGVGEYVFEVGPLADGFLPPDNTFGTPQNTSSSSLLLEEFLNSCNDGDDYEPYPICVGFGSMPFHQVEIVLNALERLNQKAVLVGNALRVPNKNPHHPHRSKIFTIASVPYAYLLPRCSMMLCHGGAGVVQACLRAGIPCLVSPVMGDQFAFGQLVQAKGLGSLCDSSSSTTSTTTSTTTKRSDKLLTCEDIVQAIERARLCRHKCQELGDQIRRGERQSGVQKLVDLMETMI